MTEQDKRICVHVNARKCLREVNANACYFTAMEDGWVKRLWEAIEQDGRSERAICLAADVGVNYLNQTRRRGTHPVSDKLAKILDALGPEAALYVMTGLELSAEDQAFLTLLAQYSPDQKRAAREVIAAVLSHQVAAEPLPSPTATTQPTSAE